MQANFPNLIKTINSEQTILKPEWNGKDSKYVVGC